ncbi:MAG: hypothetical protein AAGK00_11925 [Pseudomonadota bacterium]
MADRHYTDRHPDILDDVPMAQPDEPKRWLDDKKNVNKIVWAVYAVSAALLLFDPLVHKHGYFDIEHWFGFYGIYGFVGCVGLVLGAKEIRKLVMRSEDYYDPDKASAEVSDDR